MIFEDLVQLEMEERILKNYLNKQEGVKNSLNELDEIVGQCTKDRIERYDIANREYINETNDENINWEQDAIRDVIGCIGVDGCSGIDIKDDYYYDEYINAWMINGQEVKDREIIKMLDERKDREVGEWD